MTPENENGGAVDAEPVTHQEHAKPVKVPSRANSQWATGKRRKLDSKLAPKGFARGARVK